MDTLDVKNAKMNLSLIVMDILVILVQKNVKYAKPLVFMRQAAQNATSVIMNQVQTRKVAQNAKMTIAKNVQGQVTHVPSVQLDMHKSKENA